MQKSDFREALLEIMEAKDHWAWPAFTTGKVAPDKLHIHLEQEYATYVRDFPIMVGWAYVQCPIAEVRRGLAENIFEEETGGLSGGRPHPELFLEYPRGLGMDLSRFECVELLPGAAAYRGYLDESVRKWGWATATAIATLFIEGTKWDRGELDELAPRRPEPPLSEHPLVKHYGLPLEHLALTKVHRGVEGSHRAAAWRAILDFAPEAEHASVLERMRGALAAWKTYRDDVAAACGLTSPKP
ncbi:MAG: iron-containing redox enzyme family protein [Deltaproteobacteria bacterium]|nr:iron-containing redox enzyme family protein [Deltaproteobacteria bacterium]